MKVVFFRHSLLSRGGDKMIAIHASNLAAQGHEVLIKTNLVETVFELDARVRMEKLSFVGKIGTLLSAALSRHDCDRLVADIVPLIPLLAVRNRQPLVYFAQDYDESYYTTLPKKLLIRLLYSLALSLLKVPSLAVSRPLASLLKTRFGARVALCENGVDSTVFFPDPDPELIAAKKERKAVVILSRSDPRKGFDIAVRAAALLRESCSTPLEIWTVGENAQGKFPGFVHRDFGYLPEVRLRQVFSSADLLLYPTRHEGFPLMVLESYACRCPVVTTDAVPYAVHEENALLFSKGDPVGAVACLTRILEDQLLRNRLVAKGEEFAAGHTLARALTVFADALAAAGASYAG